MEGSAHGVHGLRTHAGADAGERWAMTVAMTASVTQATNMMRRSSTILTMKGALTHIAALAL